MLPCPPPQHSSSRFLFPLLSFTAGEGDGCPPQPGGAEGPQRAEEPAGEAAEGEGGAGSQAGGGGQEEEDDDQRAGHQRCPADPGADRRGSGQTAV